MTERGLPIVDSPIACPFVAFADDRDERASAPDHRHRCYAESPPAPRALAHQEAYCLAAAFPVCPIFQDWARREAARASDAPSGRTSGVGRPDPGLVPVDPDAAAWPGENSAEEPIYEDPRPVRNPRPGWSAPPPWMNRTDEELGAGDPGETGGDEGGSASTIEAAAAGGLAGSVADRLASSTSAAGGVFAPRDAPAAEPADWEARRDASAASPTPPGPVASSPAGPSGAPAAEPTQASSVAEGAAADGAGAAGAAAAAAAAAAAGAIARHRERERREQLVAPSWERPARLEAYPTLRERRIPSLSVPPLLVGLVALLLAALVLFLLPGFLGLGGNQAAVSAPPSLQASLAPLGSGPATTAPQATQQVYLVRSGDTMSKIANRFHVLLQTLIDANKATVPNPDNLKIGQTIIIPTTSTTPTTIPGSSGAAASP